MILTCVTAVFNAIKSGNRENLGRCVKSVAALKTEHEHLIYDGASSDGTVEVLRELERTTPGLKVVSEPDTGIYNALNKGVRDAKGEWFYVLGCDDYICHPDVMDNLLCNTRNASIIATEVYLDEEGEENIRVIDKCNTLWGMPYCHQGVIMLSCLLKKNSGFDEKYKICADYKSMLLCHLQGVKVRYYFGSESIFSCFSQSGISATNSQFLKQEENAILAEIFNLHISNFQHYRERHYLPLRVFSRYLFHTDEGIRLSARNMSMNWYRRNLRPILLPLVVLTRPFRRFFK